MIRKRLPTKCPVCDQDFKISKLTCSYCKSELHGDFQLNEFSKLDKDKLDLLRLYLVSRGNLSKVASIMKISYPTALDRFNKLINDILRIDKEITKNDSFNAKSQKDIDIIFEKSDSIRKSYTHKIISKYINNKMTEKETIENIIGFKDPDVLSQEEVDELIKLLKNIKMEGE